MEGTMKTLYVVYVAAALLAAEARGGDTELVLKDTVLRTCAPVAAYRAMNVIRYQPACVISLRHPIEGVVECALRDAMLLKIARPGVDVPDIKSEIDQLATDGASPVIRYKAWLVKQVYEEPEIFADEAAADFYTAEEAFTAVARKLERRLLAARQ